jgi:prepilin-type N-terminal cleavage/methylation domain-containing protein
MAVLCFVAELFWHGGREMKHQRGFTLIEMLVVVAIILIIAAVTIPSMTGAKVHADEASAVASIRAINQAEVSYMATYGGYAESLANLGGAEPCTRSAATACILDQSLAGGEKSGYHFVAMGSNPSDGMSQSYFVGAAPVVFDRTGKRLFCSSDKGVIRADLNTTGSTAPPDAEQCAEFKALQ